MLMRGVGCPLRSQGLEFAWNFFHCNCSIIFISVMWLCCIIFFYIKKKSFRLLVMFVYCITSVTQTTKMTLVLVFPASSPLVVLWSVKVLGYFPFSFPGNLPWLLNNVVLNINKTLIINKNHFLPLDLFNLCLFWSFVHIFMLIGSS